MLFTFYMPFCIRYFIPTSALYAASTQSRDETKNNGVSSMCDNDIVMYSCICTGCTADDFESNCLGNQCWVGAESNWLRLVGEEIFDPRAGGSEHLKVVQFGGSPDGSRWLSPFWGLMVMAPSMDHFAL